MGVPKFFRYISERYPCLSEVVKEYQIPEFDNLYLDMNGIIHTCSHPDDNNPHFRITEEKIFRDVFHYIEVLFRMIRPQKVFFMAIDGVAPRAKMNQQRGRRFRSAKDAQKQEQEATRKGEKLPTQERFDSNCITPGTVFMARLHEQLKYFVSEKISHDPLWGKCKVILSGHETPGEGEHKIMDYIRYLRAQPGYDPNTRHCLYGLDADLIMLGLCTHEPHFSLLREEVKFGRKANSKRMSAPEEITFFLLHLSLMREYLELEFTPLKDKLQGFQYDFEKIIDDWVLMGFLVGNDFIPHLPNLHIANGALPILYKAYMDILPLLDGYINESGTLNLVRFEKFMEKLGELDLEHFEEVKDDLLYMESKTGRKHNAHIKVSSKIRDLEEWSPEETDKSTVFESLEDEKPMDSDLAALIKETDDLCDSSDESGDSDEDDAFTSFKKDYYMNKLEYANVTPEVMKDQAEGYVRAIQWNLNYYYNGVCSWSWFYPHHYAPYISDVKGFANLRIDFELGKPFKPYEQLLAVLPSASKTLLPLPYHSLMTDDNSLIKKYYPENFQTDLNGKRQEWEAVVLLPFLDESQLLEAMAPCNEQLSPEEIARNTHGPMLVYEYTAEDLGQYAAPEYFPTVPHNHAIMHSMSIEDIRVPKEKLVNGAYPGVTLDIFYPGFPTMKHLKYKADLRKARVKVFEQPSRNENMIVTIISEDKYLSDEFPTYLLDKCVFVNWPHLQEAKVVGISNETVKYVSLGPGQYDLENRSDNPNDPTFRAELNGVVERYRSRLGIDVGDTKMILHVKIMIGRKYMFTPNGRLTLEKQFAENTSVYPIQTIVTDIQAYDAFHTVFRDIFEVFPEGSKCFVLTNPYYGSQGKVLDSRETFKTGRLKLSVSFIEEPDFSSVRDLENVLNQKYKTLTHAASQLGMSNFLFSRITGSIYFSARDGEGGLKKVTAGLDLKFNKKNKETPGYTRKLQNTWYYTDKSVELVREFSEKFPEIFDYLKNEDKSNDDITIERVFGDKWEEKMKELQSWLKTIPTHNIERKTCGGSVMEAEIIQEIEKVIDETKNKLATSTVTVKIKPSFLYKPDIQSGTLPPDQNMDVKLFDRVVNVRRGFSIPYGLKGTIIGINEVSNGSDRDTIYDVLFDEVFKDGMDLNCSPGRGYKVPKTSFINISYGKRLMEKKTGKPAELMAKAEAHKFHPGLPQNSNLRQNPFIPMQVQRQFSNPQPENPTNDTPKLLTNNQQSSSLETKPSDVEPEKNDAQPKPAVSREPSSAQQQNYYQQQSENNRKFYQQQYMAQQKRIQQIEQQAASSNRYKTQPAGNYQPQRLPPNVQPRMVPNPQQAMYSQPNIPMQFQRAYSIPQQRQFEPSVALQQQQFVNSKYYQQPEANKSIGNQQNSAFAQFSSDSNQMNNKQGAKAKTQNIPRGMNNFMPDFKKTEKEAKKELAAPMVNTDFLKKILNIGESQNKAKAAKNEQKAASGSYVPSNSESAKKKSEHSSGVSFEMFAQAAKAPASVRLLTYYQSNGLGLPRYQYFNTKGNVYAQISLPNGESITGKPEKTREEASESVATNALDLLIRKTVGGEAKKSEPLPVPPTSWVEPQKENVTPKPENKNNSGVISNSMVPLQALRRQVSKNRDVDNKEQNSDTTGKTVKSEVIEETIVSERKVPETKPAPPAPNGTPKQKKEKKIRIAANFQAFKN